MQLQRKQVRFCLHLIFKYVFRYTIWVHNFVLLMLHYLQLLKLDTAAIYLIYILFISRNYQFVGLSLSIYQLARLIIVDIDNYIHLGVIKWIYLFIQIDDYRWAHADWYVIKLLCSGVAGRITIVPKTGSNSAAPCKLKWY